MVKTQFQIPAPADFNFRRTVYSHGWYDLPPFELDKDNWILTRTFDFENAPPVSASIREIGSGLEIEVYAEVNKTQAAKIERDFRRVLQLDEDFSDFYRLTKGEKDFSWISDTGAGRLLRSPTVWEDLVKTICTTNCSWALTKKMVVNLVEKLGETTQDGRKSFPAPSAMAAHDTDFYKNEIRAGYRSAYFAELAEKAAGGKLDVESW
ncbi:MAG TPA: hypothetical protein VEX64_03280, partial [Pyrinomonadaceae bacterium]|nr:hypothetical protein [Pyrinomonadaceae bacterium]